MKSTSRKAKTLAGLHPKFLKFRPRLTQSGDFAPLVTALQNLAKVPGALVHALASWSAVVLYRFSPEREEAEDQVSPVVHPARVVKAPEDWRSPRPGGVFRGPPNIAKRLGLR